jgi:hypothetical protein
MALSGGAELVGAITRAMIAHEALGLDAEGGAVSQGMLQEEDRALLSFIRHDLSKGQAGSFIDANVHKLPTGPAHLIASIARHAVTGAHDSSQLFDIEVKQLAGELALATHHRRRRLQRALDRRGRAGAPSARPSRGRVHSGARSRPKRRGRGDHSRARGVRRGLRCGREERSRNPTLPSARTRASHLRTLRSERPAWSAAALTLDCWARMARTIRSRPRAVRRAL